MRVWEIIDERAFERFAGFIDRDAPRLYMKREDAEEAARPAAESAHKEQVDDFCRLAMAGELDHLYESELAWWLARPPIAIHRTDEQTFYGCGEPGWDTGDRRGAAYGWIVAREVVE